MFGAYRIGDGPFPPWYKERETDGGGEFSVGVGVPLLKNRAIDKRRSEVAQSRLAVTAVDPAVRAQLLEFVRTSSQSYWEWVAAGRAVEAFQELLRLALKRVEQIEERVQQGDVERIVQLNNRQLIAFRETKLIEAQRKLQASAIKLSLFLRDDGGSPLVPHPLQLPTTFPTHADPDPDQLDHDISAALQSRPEFFELDLPAQQISIELAQAENSLLPKLDALVETSKDVGAPASEKEDKTPLELEAGLYGEVPLQRREAKGKIESARGKLAQIRAKREYQTNKVTAQVQDAVSGAGGLLGRIHRAQTNVELARQTLELGQISFNAGDIDLVSLNIYEQAVTDAELVWIAAQADYFVALGDYRAALGEDSLAD